MAWSVLAGAVLIGAELTLVFGSWQQQFRIQGTPAYQIEEFNGGAVVAHAFLMRGNDLRAVSVNFLTNVRVSPLVKWTLWQGTYDRPQEMRVSVQRTETIELRAGRSWHTFDVIRDGSSHDRWYTFEIQLADPRPDLVPRVSITASRNNPDRGGVLWVNMKRELGSLFIRAHYPGRSLYRRFLTEAESHLPRPLRVAGVQFLIVVLLHWSAFVIGKATLADSGGHVR